MNHSVRAAAALAALGVRVGLGLVVDLGVGRVGVVGVGVGVRLRQARHEVLEAGERAWVVGGARLGLERGQLGARIEGREAGAAKA